MTETNPRFLKYGPHWRYVYELEKEIRLWKLRRQALLCGIVLAFLIGLLIGRTV